MKFYNRTYASDYDELITYYPRYYRDVFEMDAILRAVGSVTDDLTDDIERVYFNNFLDHCDEETLRRYEAFLGIQLNRFRTLDERRRFIKAFIAGFGKISASMIAGMIYEYTHADVDIWFEPSDEIGNNTLYIHFKRGNISTLYMSDIITLLSKKLPAHIDWHLAIVYSYSVVTSAKRVNYRIDYPIAGTRPEAAQQASYLKTGVAVSEKNTRIKADHAPTQEDGICGTLPDSSALGFVHNNPVVTSTSETRALTDFEAVSEDCRRSGTFPDTSTLAEINTVSVAVEKSEENVHTDHRATGVHPEASVLAQVSRTAAVIRKQENDYIQDLPATGVHPEQSVIAGIQRASAAVSEKMGNYMADHAETAEDGPKAGTVPDTAMLAGIVSTEVASEALRSSCATDIPKTDGTVTGLHPEASLLASAVGAKAGIGEKDESALADYPSAGTAPETSTFGRVKKLPAGVTLRIDFHTLDLPGTSEERTSGTVPLEALKGSTFTASVEIDSGIRRADYKVDPPTCGELKLD